MPYTAMPRIRRLYPFRRVALTLLWGLLAPGVALSAPGTELKIGQPAPDFALPDEQGKVHHLSDYRGRTVVLMFYPKDFTPG